MSLRATKAIAIWGLIIMMTGSVGAQSTQRPLSQQARTELDTISAELNTNNRKRDDKRQSARDIAREIETLRTQIISVGRSQGSSEKRASIYRARLETLNLLEADMTRRLGSVRNKQARLLSALQIYSRNPPPTLFVSSRKANDAVIAAIILKEITPELKARANALAEQNRNLMRLRRQAAIQSEALFISESDISNQQKELEALLAQRTALEDELLKEADAYEARNLALEARSRKLKGLSPLKILSRKPGERLNLPLPIVGQKLAGWGQVYQGKTHEGIKLKAASGAQVRAPTEGDVQFAGPLDGYGQVVILDIGQDYRLVMTGLGRVYVEQGATIGAGEPLGRMPNQTDRDAVFYLELRKGDTAINPDLEFDLSKL
jgi:murein hydrolase activator